MIHNRSVPVNIVLPHVFYEDVAAASAWLHEAFGFVEHYRFELPDGRIHGALIRHGEAWVMLKSSNRTSTGPSRLGGVTQSLMFFTEDVESHYRVARSAQARISEELNVTEYGEKHYVAVDPEGHPWIFAEHIRDVDPEEWGAYVHPQQP